MATGKRYYWIKLKESFMTSDTVDYLMSKPNGANYVVLYQMLCLKTINTDGRLSRQIGEILVPFDVEKIQRDCKWFSADTIRVALNLYKAFGLIYEDIDGTLVMTDHENLVGSETDYAKQKRSQRNESLPRSRGGQCPHQCLRDASESVHTDIRDKEIRDQIPDNRYPDTEKESGESTTSEPAAVLTLTLNDKSEYPITQEDISEWMELYPAVDIMQELRKMKGWCKDNPTKRKTRRGIRRFIGSWLSREQDKYHAGKGGGNGTGTSSDRKNSEFGTYL